MKVRYRTDRIAWCTLTPGFYVTRCIITLGFSFLFLLSSGTYIVTLLNFLFLCHDFLLFVVFFSVCLDFNLPGSTLLGFLLVGCTTSFRESTSSSRMASGRTCPKTQYFRKLMENQSALPCSLDM